MKANKIILSVVLFFSLCFGAAAQTNTFYFMDEVPVRHNMNPAFMPNCSGYLDFIFPSLYFELGNNALAFKDLVYNNNNNLVTPFSPNSGGIDKLYKRFPQTTALEASFGYNILSFGFRAKEKNYFTFGLSLKADAGLYIPRDVFKFLLYGTPDEYGVNHFNLNNLGLNAMVYGELGLGYTRQINKKWNFGFKLKGLVGIAGIFTDVNNLSIDASKDKWTLAADANAYLMNPKYFGWDAAANKFTTNENFSNDWKNFIQGLGGALDLGVTFEPVKNLVVSASVIDLGFIRWNKPQDIIQFSSNGEFEYNGGIIDENFNLQNTFDSLSNSFLSAFDYTGKQGTDKKINQWLTTKINVGIEYGVFNNKISFGALSNTRINQRRVMEEVTLALNFRPADWFKTYFSYSFTDGRGSNLGFGVSFRMGCINTYLVTDYIP
ncbi:MAG: DUF5723 family protein, partial [Prevotellaceae bacterium]|nr:DUF5723 family protein [Prevotellaceae bacterium]